MAGQERGADTEQQQHWAWWIQDKHKSAHKPRHTVNALLAMPEMRSAFCRTCYMHELSTAMQLSQ